MLRKANKNRVVSILGDHANKVRSKWRKVITGDEKKRIRDLIKEKENEPSYIRLFDKISFTMGVLNITICQYFLFNHSQYFWLWYSIVIPIVSITRFVHFKRIGLQYFLIDFCYFVNFLVFINLYLFPSSSTPHSDSMSNSNSVNNNMDISSQNASHGFYYSLSENGWDGLTYNMLQSIAQHHVTDQFFKIMFIFTNGPLTIAIAVWRCSLVFHDYDKITSVFIHLLPCMLYYTGHWYGHEPLYLNLSKSNPIQYRQPIQPSLYFSDYVHAAILYLFWQTCYYIKTEIVDKEKLDQRPDLLTSLRWLSTDTKNALARSVLKLMRKLSIFSPNEDYDSTTMKTKVVFMSVQFVYTLLTFLVTPMLYWYQSFHIGYIIFIFTLCVYNGGSFYIDIFSKRYESQLESIKALLDEREDKE